MGHIVTKDTKLRRGMTQARYRAALRMIQAGKTTWEKLEQAGISQPVRCERMTIEAELEKSLEGNSETIDD
jgi:hypothetical protein